MPDRTARRARLGTAWSPRTPSLYEQLGATLIEQILIEVQDVTGFF
jgi:hypothetical protein